MVITDLKQSCPHCRGSGHQPGFTSLGVAQINYDGRCPRCAGRGFQLTELGEDLLALLRPFIQEQIDGGQPKPAPAPRPNRAADSSKP